MFKIVANSVLNLLGYQIVNSQDRSLYDLEEGFYDVYSKCHKYTLTSIQRLYSLYKATEYVVNANVPGDIVECGVWRGGSCMLTAFTLLKMGNTQKRICLYDTYEGMAQPTEKDIEARNDLVAWKTWKRHQKETLNKWCYSPIEEVKVNMISTGYPQDKLVFVKGKVEETIPKIMPDKISILRLDTDWYESTYHELCHLFPRLSKFGVIIIDDYGFWKGVREATDKYLTETKMNLLLNRIDECGRIGIKVVD
jgi:O-methyltransferase